MEALLLNFGIKLGLTGGTGFIVIWGVFFGWFQLSLKKLKVGFGLFRNKRGWFQVVSARLGWFRLFSRCSMLYVPLINNSSYFYWSVTTQWLICSAKLHIKSPI